MFAHKYRSFWCLFATGMLLLPVSGNARQNRAPQAGPARSTEEVVVLKSDARSCVIEYHPKFSPLRTFKTAEGEFTVLDFLGATPPPMKLNTGSPDLHFRHLALAVPSETGCSVQVIGSDYEDIPNISIAPVPVLRSKDGILEVSEYRKNPERYAGRSFQPSAVAEISAISRTRSVLVAGVHVFPLQYNASSRILRKYSRIVVEITFGTPGSTRPYLEDLRLLQGSLLNYQAARTWASTAPSRAKVALASSVLASGDWYRIAVADEGIYRIDANYLKSVGISLSGLDPRTIKIYCNGGADVPEDLTIARPTDLKENAISVVGESDGQFDATDYVLFYARPAKGWQYDPAAKTFRHYINHFSDVNYYWLTFGGGPGLRMQHQVSGGSGSVVVEQFRDRVFVEEEKVKPLDSGKDWYGQSINAGSSFTHMNLLPGLVPNSTIFYRYTLVSGSDKAPLFTVREGNTILGSYALAPISSFTVGTSAQFEAQGTSTLANNTSQLNFAFSSGSALGGWIDWLEILYPRVMWGVGEFLRFRSPDTSATLTYRLQQFASQPLLFDVTDLANVRLIDGVTGSYQFSATEVAGRVSEYCAAGPSSWKTPPAATKIANQDLHGYSGGADFIIVTSQEFRPAADRLKAYREQPAHGNLKTVVVNVDQIYNEFAGGLPDISAIRDYLRYAYGQWTPRPTFVLMFGGASYDYKGILGSKSSFVPTWQSPESLDDVFSYSTDDFFAKFGLGDNISLVLGRFSSRTLAEANIVVDKVFRYEDNSIRDNWKMRILYIGDDGWTTEGLDEPPTQHSDAAEELAGPFYTPDELEKKKIYIAEYPTANTAVGRRKPGAFQAIIDQINQGLLIANYSGHGRRDLLAHEDIFDVNTSLPQLTNQDKLLVFFLATCGFSQFDDPAFYTGSELLVNKPDGGAVAVVSATRKVFAGDNRALNDGVFKAMFTRDAFGRVLVERPATALFTYKAVTGSNSDNDQKYCFMGDPTMRLQYPQSYASIDSINHQAVDSVNGGPRLNLIELKSLGKVTVSGTIRGTNDAPDPSYNGTLSLAVNDATRQVVIVEFAPGVSFAYQATGGTIYRGGNSIVNGKFSADFIVPKDIAFADSVSNGRVVAYFTNGNVDGAGYTGLVRVGGTDTTASKNSRGPNIALYLDSRSFRPGDLVTDKPMLLMDLADSNGINTSVSGIGHRIEVWVNSSTQSKDVTDFYASKLDSYREGTVQYQLSDLPLGRNSIRARAWDSFNNSAVAETFFEVASSEQLTIADVFNYPNPFSGETFFTFRQNLSDPINIVVKIYTVAGRAIQTLIASSAGELFVRIPWDGRDRDGDIIANGVYLYKIVVKTVDGRFSSEALGKLSVLK